jgi:hypothetical protein
MSNPYAVLADLENRFPRDLSSDEVTRAETLLVDASFWLGVWVPGLTEAVVGGNEDAAQAAKLLTVAMVKRALLTPALDDNPGVQSTNEVVGPFQRQVTYRNPEGNLYLYARELEDLTSLLRSTRAGAVSMRSPGL